MVFSETTFSIILFFIVALLGYFPSYYRATARHIGPSPSLRSGSYSYVLVVLAVITITSVLIGSSGMLRYHSLRAEIAIGIFVYIYSYQFTGWRKAILLAIFGAILIYSLGIYSRRPFLTLAAPVLLVPLIQKRIPTYLALPGAVLTVAIAGAGLLYITGLRYLGTQASLLEVVALVHQGLLVFLQGEGFDTVWLTQYVVESYDASNYHLGGTFLGGLFNFVPRAVWADKPIAFGMILSAEYFYVQIEGLFTNFGPGIVAEAYANGGLLAVIMIAFIFGLVIGRVDRAVEVDRFNCNRILFACVFYPAIFFMIRGDFLNSFYELYSKTLVIFLMAIVLRVRLFAWPASTRLSR